jgi:hypothetical protein
MPESARSPSPQTAARPDGRETLDAAKRRKIAALLSIGLSRRMAAEKAGCAHSTIARAADRDAAFAAELAEAEAESGRDPQLKSAVREAFSRAKRPAAAATATAADPKARRRLRRGLRAEHVIGMLVAIADSARPRVRGSDICEFLRVLSACLAPIDGAARPACPHCRGTVDVARAVKALSDNILRTQFPSARARKYRRALARDLQQRTRILFQKDVPDTGLTES